MQNRGEVGKLGFVIDVLIFVRVLRVLVWVYLLRKDALFDHMLITTCVSWISKPLEEPGLFDFSD